MSATAAEIVAALASVHEDYAPPDIDQRTAAWWWGRPDDNIAWWLCMAKQAAPDHMAQSLYLAHVAEDMSCARDIKEWAYAVAAEIAHKRHRGRAAVESYAPQWGRQAARDGCALALWPHLAEYVRGYASQARAMGCHPRAYLAIREGVLSRTRDALSAFRYDMDCLRRGLISKDFAERHGAGSKTSAVSAARLDPSVRHTE